MSTMVDNYGDDVKVEIKKPGVVGLTIKWDKPTPCLWPIGPFTLS